MAAQILVIDDDVPFCMLLKTFLSKKGFELRTAFSASEGRSQLAGSKFDAVITDIRLPDASGLDILHEIKRNTPETKVILITGYTDIKAAVHAMKEGAFDYVGKPINPDELLHTLQLALKTPDAPVITPTVSAPKTDLKFITGIGDASRELHEMATVVAPTNLSVLIQGDSGTGKEYLAQSIHRQSKRASKPFVAVDCGAIPKELASSEFFGHIKGSFTGAVNDKSGHFEAANGGTLFLDEVGNLNSDVQIQLLRALQERKVKPVGSSREITVDIRVIAATNEDLMDAVKRGDFREDLYHRLNEFFLQVPRLADRGSDVMTFAHHFLALANEELDREILGFEPDAEQLFLNYDWPGNLREMKNTVRRCVLLCKSNLIAANQLPPHMREKEETELQGYSVREHEESAIRKALDEANFNKSKAAKLLEIDRKTLYNKLRQYQIEA